MFVSLHSYVTLVVVALFSVLVDLTAAAVLVVAAAGVLALAVVASGGCQFLVGR